MPSLTASQDPTSSLFFPIQPNRGASHLYLQTARPWNQPLLVTPSILVQAVIIPCLDTAIPPPRPLCSPPSTLHQQREERKIAKQTKLLPSFKPTHGFSLCFGIKPKHLSSLLPAIWHLLSSSVLSHHRCPACACHRAFALAWYTLLPHLPMSGSSSLCPMSSWWYRSSS